MVTSASGQSWIVAETSQKLPRQWSWSVKGQLRTPASSWTWNEGIVDFSARRGWAALPGWSLEGQWRAQWNWPVEGGWTQGWRWALAARWKKDIGDHAVAMRLRHQQGGDWMRPWDRARWRLKAKWTHDLPKGWKLIPSCETFWGAQTLMEGTQRWEAQSFRARLSIDKKVKKRRKITTGYQFQSALRDAGQPVEHTLLLMWQWTLKKRKPPKGGLD